MALVNQISIPGIPIPKVIRPAQHALLDYGVAATFLAAGAAMQRTNRRAAALAFLNGGLVLGMSLFTDYPGGVWRRMSFKAHGAMDVVQAGLAGLGPGLLGFGDEPEAAFFYAQAASEVAVIAATDWDAPVNSPGAEGSVAGGLDSADA